MASIPTTQFGKSAEGWAEKFLVKQGYRILQKNFRAPTGEIDLVALDKDTICFVEVKARHSDIAGEGMEAVSAYKRRRLIQTALIYLRDHEEEDRYARFDVLSLDYEQGIPQPLLIKNAFDVS